MIDEVSDGPAITDAADCGGCLGPDLVLRIIQQSDERRKRTLGTNLAQNVRSPSAGGPVISFVEHRDQWSHHSVAVTRQDVCNPGSEPHVRVLECPDQRLDGPWVGDSRERTQRDLADIGVFGAGSHDRLEQCWNCLGATHSAEQLGGERAVTPLAS
jgi:hypothetical protein